MRRAVIAVLLALATLAACAPSARPTIDAVTHGLIPVVDVRGEEQRFALADRMRHYKVHGVGIAVFDHDRLVWARGFGDADAESHTPVTDATLFQAASISKPVNALAVLRAVERGELSLDTPINDQLRTWKLDGPPVTLRQLLSHTAGTNVHGVGGYARDAKLPTLAQILDGDPAVESPKVVVEITPGTKYQYSGGGVTVAQLALVEHANAAYPDLLAREVLGPIGMTSSTFAQPLPADRERFAATGYQTDGTPLPGKWNLYPASAAAGLWTTPTDLAKFFLEIQRARAGRSRAISQRIATQMTTAIAPAGDDWQVTLGMFLHVRGGTTLFTHDGGHAGFACDAVASLDGGYGVVVMTNSEAGTELVLEIERAVFAAYGWPGNDPQIVRVPKPATELARYAGAYGKAIDPAIVAVAHGRLEMRRAFGEATELVPVGGDAFVARADGERYELTTQLAGKAPLVELEAGRLDAAALHAIGETDANEAAYAVLERDPAAAVNLFALIVDAFPDSMNAHESLAEGYEAAHDDAHALAAYRDALAAYDRDAAAPVEARDKLRATCDAAIRRLAK